ncbi:hypothetical protein B0H14DRAFT_3760004, partial [Mycena olivaceomarginata]
HLPPYPTRWTPLHSLLPASGSLHLPQIRRWAAATHHHLPLLAHAPLTTCSTLCLIPMHLLTHPHSPPANLHTQLLLWFNPCSHLSVRIKGLCTSLLVLLYPPAPRPPHTHPPWPLPMLPSNLAPCLRPCPSHSTSPLCPRLRLGTPVPSSLAAASPLHASRLAPFSHPLPSTSPTAFRPIPLCAPPVPTAYYPRTFPHPLP